MDISKLTLGFRNRISIVLFIFSVAILISPLTNSQTCDNDAWSGAFSRAGHMVVYDMQWSNGKLYVGGKAQLPEKSGNSWTTVEVYGVFIWDGVSWTYPTVDQSLTGGGSFPIKDIEVVNGTVYVGGSFTGIRDGRTISYVAVWNGTDWAALGTGTNGVVNTLAWGGGFDLYVGGQFTTAGDSTASNIAKWNGSSWSTLLDGIGPAQGVNSTVNDIAMYAGGVAVAGTFSVAGGSNVNRLALWSAGTWSAIGGGMNATPTILLPTSAGLYVGGNFSSIPGPIAAYGIVLWDGGSWNLLGTAQFTTVYDMGVSTNGNIIVAGAMNQTTNVENQQIAQWDGFSWSKIDATCNFNAQVFKLAMAESNQFYARFNGSGSPCGIVPTTLAKWSGSSWSSVGEGLNTNASIGEALLYHDSSIYLGGLFGWAGGEGFQNGLARRDLINNRWNSMGENDTNGVKLGNFDGWVHSLAEMNDVIYLGGDFTSAGVTSANNIASWNGSSFSSLGNGVSTGGIVYDLAFFVS